jgi:anthranilate phosphoribosyltransferase
MQGALARLERRENLSSAETADAMTAIMQGLVSDDTIERFLVLLRDKGETVTEIASAARVLRTHALKLERSHPGVIDTCGTGGDGSATLNVSTLAALAASASGLKVAKHGNRSVSSICGSADVLEALGVPVEADPAKVEDCLDVAGFGFFFAPKFHPAVRYAMSARKKIGTKTLFNLLGPLANPAGALRQVVGVYSAALTETMAGALKELGSERALVVYGSGMDEISLTGVTRISELKDGSVKTYDLRPEETGFLAVPAGALKCSSVDEAKAAALAVLSGKKSAALDIVALNAGAAAYLAGKAGSIPEGAAAMVKTLESGAGLKKLEEIKRLLL